MEDNRSDGLRRSRLMYIIEAGLEYLISILVAGSFLATLTKELGISDSITGTLSSVISLGCLFQLISLSVRRTRVKKFVLILSVLNQLLFLMLYVIPLTGAARPVKTVMFVAAIFLAYLIYNFAHPKKISWLMSLVDDHNRGTFTANKEIVSLISGMIFSFAMGALVDYFAEIKKIKLAFIISAAVIFVLMVSHTLTMIFTVEKETPQTKSPEKISKSIMATIKNKEVLQVTAVFVIYYISNYASHPFYGTYQINELGFSLKLVQILTIAGSATRVLVSRFWGKYADKKSFAAMIEKCFLFLAAANVCVIFAVPSNGKIMFMLYYVLHGISMGGINSALINLIFDHVASEKRADSLAISQASAGAAGFLTTLCVSPLVSNIQNNGNTLFGLNIYAQQAITVISLIAIIVAVIYVRIVIMKKSIANINRR